MTKKAIFFLVTLWWGWTVIIDFAVVPTVFKIINDFFNAGELGVALFSKLNFLEFLTSIILFPLCLYQVKTTGKGKLQLSLITGALAIILLYISFLTPKIEHLTTLWKAADLKGAVNIGNIKDIQQEHQFFHKIYVSLDTIKLLLLSTVLGLNAKT